MSDDGHVSPSTMHDMVEVVMTIEAKGWTKLHTSTAKFRSEMHDKSTDTSRKNKIYAWLLYRKHRRTGFRRH